MGIVLLNQIISLYLCMSFLHEKRIFITALLILEYNTIYEKVFKSFVSYRLYAMCKFSW